MLSKRILVCAVITALAAFATTAEAANSRRSTKKKTTKTTKKSSIIKARGTVAPKELPPKKGQKRKRTVYVLKTADAEYYIAGTKASALRTAAKEQPEATFEVTGRVVTRNDQQKLYVSSFKVAAQEKAAEDEKGDKKGEGKEEDKDNEE